MNEQEVQLEVTKLKLENEKQERILRFQMEELRHKHILEEIEAMKKAKITAFVRQVQEK